jgi:D-sedoheptulose 7-phosphate isomerase
MINKILSTNIESSIDLHKRLINACLGSLNDAAEVLIAAYRGGHKAVFFGNGGSAADAQHLAAEFVGQYQLKRRPLPALALNVNNSAVTAISNDFGYDQVFAPTETWPWASVPRAIREMCCKHFIVRRMGLNSIALSGASGGQLVGLVDVLIAVPSEQTPRIQECHILLGHALCDAVEQTIASTVCHREGV